MSWKVSGACWDLDLPANKMLVLLALADHADHEGNNVYPSIGLVAWKTGYSENQVRRIMHALVKDGILVEVNRTPGKVVKYSIDTSKGKTKAGYTPKEKKHSQSDTPTNMIAHPSQNGSPTPTIAVVAEPSLEPINNQKNHSAPNGAGASPDKQPKPRKREPFYDAIADVWETDASGIIVTIRSIMQGAATRRTIKDCNFNPPVTDVEEIYAFRPFMKARMAEKKMTAPPSAYTTIQAWFYDFRKGRVKKQSAPQVVIAPEPVEEVVTAGELAARRALTQSVRPEWEMRHE